MTAKPPRKASVLIDAWKLPVFKSVLRRHNYTFTEGPGLTKDTLQLIVPYHDQAHVTYVVQLAQEACAAKKGTLQ